MLSRGEILLMRPGRKSAQNNTNLCKTDRMNCLVVIPKEVFSKQYTSLMMIVLADFDISSAKSLSCFYQFFRVVKESLK